MYHFRATKWIHQMYIPTRRDMVMKMDHIAHDERFWIIIALAVLFVGLMLLAVFANLKNPQVPVITPVNPFLFYR